MSEYPIYVKTLSGKTIELMVGSDFNVADLKAKVTSELNGAAVTRMVFQDKDLSDASQRLSDSGIVKESIVLVMTEQEKPCHFFFALDESGSMNGGRWHALMESFAEFVDRRLEAAQKNDVPIQDVVSVFFHESGCRVAKCLLPSGEKVPFLSKRLAELTANSLVNDPSYGGNNFDAALTFIEPHLLNCTDMVPVLMFMTDGGDCGAKENAYIHMKKIKKKFRTCAPTSPLYSVRGHSDIEGAKALCAAAGMNVETHYNHIADEGNHASHGPSRGPSHPSSPTQLPSTRSQIAFPKQKKGASGAVPSSAPSASLSGPARYAQVSERSAQKQMASHWDNVYSANSLQAAPIPRKTAAPQPTTQNQAF